MKDTGNYKKVSSLIIRAYEIDSNKPEIIAFKQVIRTGRKHGFQFVCSLDDNFKKQIYWAARLLLSVINTWPIEDIPSIEDFVLEPGSVLFSDSQWVLGHALCQTKEFKKISCATV